MDVLAAARKLGSMDGGGKRVPGKDVKRTDGENRRLGFIGKTLVESCRVKMPVSIKFRITNSLR